MAVRSSVFECDDDGAGHSEYVVRKCTAKGFAHLLLRMAPCRAGRAEPGSTGFGERDVADAAVPRVDCDAE
jgi:hypothetical protein